jgi:sugar/nucleoside kinase (ribokinase family)
MHDRASGEGGWQAVPRLWRRPLNTAVHLACLGTRADYITALGNDNWSDELHVEIQFSMRVSPLVAQRYRHNGGYWLLCS